MAKRSQEVLDALQQDESLHKKQKAERPLEHDTYNPKVLAEKILSNDLVWVQAHLLRHKNQVNTLLADPRRNRWGLSEPEFVSPLYLAVYRKGQLAMVKWLLEQGADPNLYTSGCYGYACLPVRPLGTSHNNMVAITTLLLQYGADFSLRHGRYGLSRFFIVWWEWMYCDRINMEFLRLLLKKGLDLSEYIPYQMVQCSLSRLVQCSLSRCEGTLFMLGTSDDTFLRLSEHRPDPDGDRASDNVSDLRHVSFDFSMQNLLVYLEYIRKQARQVIRHCTSAEHYDTTAYRTLLTGFVMRFVGKMLNHEKDSYNLALGCLRTHVIESLVAELEIKTTVLFAFYHNKKKNIDYGIESVLRSGAFARNALCDRDNMLGEIFSFIKDDVIRVRASDTNKRIPAISL